MGVVDDADLALARTSLEAQNLVFLVIVVRFIKWFQLGMSRMNGWNQETAIESHRYRG